jgi:hypothetical protein
LLNQSQEHPLKKPLSGAFSTIFLVLPYFFISGCFFGFTTFGLGFTGACLVGTACGSLVCTGAALPVPACGLGCTVVGLPAGFLLGTTLPVGAFWSCAVAIPAVITAQAIAAATANFFIFFRRFVLPNSHTVPKHLATKLKNSKTIF